MECSEFIFFSQIAPTRAVAQVRAIQSITNPWFACQTLHCHIIALFDELQNKISPGRHYRLYTEVFNLLMLH